MKHNSLKILAVIVLLSVVLSACGTIPAANSNPCPPSISVTGRSDIFLTPDIAYVYIGVHTESENVADALNENNAQSQSISSTLEELGVAKEDVQTSAFNIYPFQDYGPFGPTPGATEDPPTKYAVDNTVFVTVRDLSKLGHILDSVVRNGANSIHNVEFDVEDKTEALAQARKEAIENGRSLAEEMAQAANISLGDLISLSVHGSDNAQPLYMEKGLGGMRAASEVPTSAGQLVLTMYAEMNFEIK
ncbi:MAG: SIMPL domain-containing protein [Anaerolineaceae bacterium]|nr:SIMPL domain-containing protein [Anaerolineaceae bacterium]